MTMSQKNVSHDVMPDILSRLPLKSLVRFRCVSKPWLHLLTNSRFPYWLINCQLSCDHRDLDIDCRHNQSCVLIPSSCYLYSVGGGCDEKFFKRAEWIDIAPFTDNSFQIKTACCDGMLCVSTGNDDANLILCNPSIKEYKVLPLPIDIGVCGGVCGLGFDSIIDDYKVVSVTKKQVFVFSVKRNSWRILGDFPYYPLSTKGIHSNGFLYWSTTKKSGVPAYQILCFDVSKETFWEVAPPPFVLPSNIQPNKNYGLDLFIKGRSLFAYHVYDQSLWMMEEKKANSGAEVGKTWTRLMTLPEFRDSTDPIDQLDIADPIDQLEIPRPSARLFLLCFTKTGKLLFSMNDGDKFVMYDPKVKKYEGLGGFGLNNSKAIAYTESLISPGSIRGMNDVD